MIPAPDLTLHWIVGISALLGIAVCGFVGGFENRFPITIAGMVTGLAIIITTLSFSVGISALDIDGEVDIWREEIRVEIANTECESLQNLSFEYKKSKLDKYTVKQIREEIKESFIYNCVDTREGWWLND